MLDAVSPMRGVEHGLRMFCGGGKLFENSSALAIKPRESETAEGRVNTERLITGKL